MSEHDDMIRMRHMLDAALEIGNLSKGRKRDDLKNDRLYCLGMTRLVEIIGEAASRLTDETRAKYARIPWCEIIGTRNRLIHGYNQVDEDILWDIISINIEPLIQELEAILR